MVICACNVLTDRQIAQAIAGGASRPHDIYAACNCQAQCGGCTAMILAMLRSETAPAGR